MPTLVNPLVSSTNKCHKPKEIVEELPHACHDRLDRLPWAVVVGKMAYQRCRGNITVVHWPMHYWVDPASFAGPQRRRGSTSATDQLMHSRIGWLTHPNEKGATQGHGLGRDCRPGPRSSDPTIPDPALMEQDRRGYKYPLPFTIQHTTHSITCTYSMV